MARTLPRQRVALNVLDWLYFNQVLVFTKFNDEHFFSLRSIVARVKEAVEATGATGIAAETMKHYALCFMEINASDDVMPKDPGPAYPAGISEDEFQQLRRRDKAYFKELLRSGRKAASGDFPDAALSIADNLAGVIAAAPPAVRYRLAERCLALEYPDGAHEAFAWFLQNGVLARKNDKTADTYGPKHESVVTRVGLLCEFEVARVCSFNHRRGTRAIISAFDASAREVSSSEMRQLVRVAGRAWADNYYVASSTVGKVLTFPIKASFDKGELGAYFDGIDKLWIRKRLCGGTTAAWPAILGAYWMMLTNSNDNRRPRGVEKKTTLAGMSKAASLQMAACGAPVSARAIRLRLIADERYVWFLIQLYYSYLMEFEHVDMADDDDMINILVYAYCGDRKAISAYSAETVL